MSKSKRPTVTVGKGNGSMNTVICTDADRPAATAIAFSVIRHGEDLAKDMGEAEDNAAFIVKSWNAYDDLVDALEASRSFIESFTDDETRYFGTRKLLMDICETLAKAKGE